QVCAVALYVDFVVLLYSSRRRHTSVSRDWSSDVCSSDLITIDPLDEKSLLEGFNMLEENISSQSKINYEIKYSPNLMRSQLEKIVEILKDKAHRKTIINISSAVLKDVDYEKNILYSYIIKSGLYIAQY